MSTSVESIKGFEKDLRKMIENIQFRRVSSAFLLKLNEDIKNIKSSKKMFISADKTQNFYEIKKEDHEKILHENVKNLQKSKHFVTKEDQYRSKKDCQRVQCGSET